jgi:hypothetical protein
MRVKLCTRCPYTPRDLEDHYDPEATAHACARCDGERDKVKMYYPLETYRRRKCSIVPKIFSISQRSAAPCVAGGSVSSGTIPGDRNSAQGNALIASRSVGRATAGGCESFKPAETASRENVAEISSRSGLGEKEVAL